MGGRGVTETEGINAGQKYSILTDLVTKILPPDWLSALLLHLVGFLKRFDQKFLTSDQAQF